MKFPWNKYRELPLERRNTLQIYPTYKCNLVTQCEACFARNVMKDDLQLYPTEYNYILKDFIAKGGQQVNIVGGEPGFYKHLPDLIEINRWNKIKTTIYTNGVVLKNFSEEQLAGAKLRVSIYSENGKFKSAKHVPVTSIPIEANYMVSSTTTLEDLLASADYVEANYNCNVFFISSIRELDNPRQEFFDDTKNTVSVIKYKELVHEFLWKYEGNMQIHVSKRGVFESTVTLPDNSCRFVNYFNGGKIIQCPYDVVNLKFQKEYYFGRPCQHNNTCLMSKVIYQPIKESK
jgi:MoaA/NifB/PqqE/SkfB family radical SAM enzyme